MKILLIAGHGAGDPGSIGCGYKEADLTRELVTLVKPLLAEYAEVSVYDFARKAKADVDNGIKYDYSQYDYVLEFHFNAHKPAANGTEIYVHTSETKTSVEGLILRNISRFGFTNRGIKKSSQLVVMNRCKMYQTPYALLETCFISNENDMRIYQQHKNEIATEIVNALVEGFKLERGDSMTVQERIKFNELVKNVSAIAERLDKIENKMTYGYIDTNMPEWAKPTIQKLVDKNLLKGDESGNLHLDETMLRILVVLDRAKIFG